MDATGGLVSELAVDAKMVPDAAPQTRGVRRNERASRRSRYPRAARPLHLFRPQRPATPPLA